MKMMRSLAALVLLAVVSITVGCGGGEQTGASGGGAAAGSGVAGAALDAPAETLAARAHLAPAATAESAKPPDAPQDEHHA